MADAQIIALDNRTVIAADGDDAEAFLQGLISNDMDRVGLGRAIYAALLTPQGKFLHDFFVAKIGGGIVLDCESSRAADLLKRLGMFKLRAKVELSETDFKVAAIIGVGAAQALGLDPAPGAAKALNGGCAFIDPRISEMGARVILPPGEDLDLPVAGAGAYEALRLELGLPDGSRDMDIDKSTLLECGFEELNGVDFDKGCYMGQELTARTKHRGLVKRRLFPVNIDGPLPKPGTPITVNGKDAGTIKSGSDMRAIALLRIEVMEQALASGTPLKSGDAVIVPAPPTWMTNTP